MTTAQHHLQSTHVSDGTFPADRSDLPAADRLAFYRTMFGWSVRLNEDGALLLALENGLCAVTIPKLASARVLRNLATSECQGPILDIPTAHGARLAVLAEADGFVPPTATLPDGVALLHSGALLPLPSSQWSPVEWFRSPDPHQRWLPSLTAVLAIVKARFW